MTADVVKVIFDRAVNMEPGSKIPLEFSNDSQRESFRVRFYNERKKYAERFGEIESNTVQCRKMAVGKKLYLIIERSIPMSVPFIVKPDGTTEIIDLEGACGSEPPEAFTAPICKPTFDLGHGSETPDQRRLRLMQEEGIYEPPTEEEEN